jgi:hypothetical protein
MAIRKSFNRSGLLALFTPQLRFECLPQVSGGVQSAGFVVFELMLVKYGVNRLSGKLMSLGCSHTFT